MIRTTLIATLLTCALFVSTAPAATVYWDSNGATAGAGATPNGTWGSSAFWSSSSAGTAATAAYTAGSDAVFAAGGDATTYTVTLSGTQTAASVKVEEGTVSFGGTGAASVGGGTVTVESGALLSIDNSARIAATAGAQFIVNGGTIRNTVGSSAGSFVDVDAVIVLNGGGTFEYTGANLLNIVQTTTIVSGTGPLTKTGVGVLAIASPSTYSGSTVVNDGELRMRGGTNRLPTGTDLVVNSPGIFNINGSGQNQTVASLAGNGRVGLAGGTLTINGATSTTFSGVIEDTANAGAAGSATTGGSITKNGASQLTLTGANTFTTLLTISSTVGNSVSIGNGGTTGSVASNIATTSNGGLIFNRSNNITYAAVVSGGGTVTKEGAGILNVNNTWTNTGGIVVNDGTFRYNNASAGLADTVPVTINNGGTFSMNGFTDTFGSLVANSSNTTGVLSMGAVGLTLGQTATTQRTYSGTITGSGTLTKSGGTWIQNLNGDNSGYSGNIVVAQGRLAVGHNNALGTTGANTQIDSGSELLFQGGVTISTAEPISVTGIGGTDNGAIAVVGSSTVDLSGPVSLAGDTQLTVGGGSSVTYSNATAITGIGTNLTVQGGAGGTGTISGLLDLGVGGLTKLQGGTWVLANAAGNSYSGLTTVGAGRLEVNNVTGSGTGSGNVDITGGTLAGTGSVAGGVTINGGTLGGFLTVGGNITLNSGSISPGASVGEVVGNGVLNLAGGSYAQEVNTTLFQSDIANIADDLNLTNLPELVVTDLASLHRQYGNKFVMISYGGDWNLGEFRLGINPLPNETRFTVGMNDFKIKYDDVPLGAVNAGDANWANAVTLMVIPEPSSLTLVALGLAVLARSRTRRQRVR